MVIKNILIYYKKSSYEIYFLRKSNPVCIKEEIYLSRQLARFKKAHDQHYDSLGVIESVLMSKGLKYTKCVRGRSVKDDSKYDFIITVGGDGTFLEAARFFKKSLLMGVNSCPGVSVGNLCVSTSINFSSILEKVITKKPKIKELCRLQLKVTGIKKPIHFLNDILAAHSNPAATSRYYITINSKTEEHRSSGLLVSTPSGSTGSMHSAGGKIIPGSKKLIQYMPRELYTFPGYKYALRGGILAPKASIQILSLMRNGAIFVDGSHYKIPFCLGSEATISISPYPVKTIL